MGADAPYPEYDERRHPANGRPCGGSSAVFMSVILKYCLAQRGPDEAAEQTHQWWDTSGTKFDTLSNPLDMTMSKKNGAGFSCWNYRYQTI